MMADCYTHPRDELAAIMSRMYRRHLTTSSGGNASIRTADGVVWMTPKGNDKGALGRDEMAFRAADSDQWQGRFPPSSEWPFHTRIYEAREDVRAVLHAHSQTLVAFSVAGRLPSTASLAQAAHLCGRIGLARYALPGSDALADAIIEQIDKHDCLIMANHGVVVVGLSLSECYQKFEALEFCARAEVRASILGGFRKWLTDEDLQAQAVDAEQDRMLLDELQREAPPSTAECELRAVLVKLVRRSYQQGLIHSQSGALSARLSSTEFLITPSGIDRQSIEPRDICLVRFQNGQASVSSAPELVPSRAWPIHRALYEANVNVHSIMHAHPSLVSAFCLTNVDLTSSVIPESYIVLRNIARLGFRASLDEASVVEAFAKNKPCSALLVDNDGVIVIGPSPAAVFDRLEVLEATANVVLECRALGEAHYLTDQQTDEIDRVWFPEARIDTSPSTKRLKPRNGI